MLKIKTLHNNLVKQLRLLAGSNLSTITDPVTSLVYPSVIKDTTVTDQEDTSTLPNYPYIVVDLITPGRRYLTAKGLTKEFLPTQYITTLRETIFKITCYGGDCSDILDKIQLLLEMDNTRGTFNKGLNASTDVDVVNNSSAKVQYFGDIREVPAFVETSYINTAETTLKISVESHFAVIDTNLIEEIQGTLIIKRNAEDPDPIEVAINAP